MLLSKTVNYIDLPFTSIYYLFCSVFCYRIIPILISHFICMYTILMTYNYTSLNVLHVKTFGKNQILYLANLKEKSFAKGNNSVFTIIFQPICFKCDFFSKRCDEMFLY
mgnify:CR=1 FL=1